MMKNWFAEQEVNEGSPVYAICALLQEACEARCKYYWEQEAAACAGDDTKAMELLHRYCDTCPLTKII